MANSTLWLALMIGNSRLHWAWFTGKSDISAWDTDHLPPKVIHQLSNCKTLEDFITHFPPSLTPLLPHSLLPTPYSLLLASVVPSQTELWQSYPNVRVITLDQIPLQGLYPTLGIDRSLALLGAGQNWGFPMLVIDAGTALTFTGADANKRLVGGAILPGLGLQFKTLAQKTGQLPMVERQEQLPQRFALKTEEAIQSGVIYTLVAGIKDFVEAWRRDYPEGKIAMTGGDRTLLINYLQSQFPEIAARFYVEQNLIFWGMRAVLTRV
ncbi:type III pantothenate kinase [Scytonema hofmannii PCC 7110]|uniref:Type III pantothenate kinase n=1 Tax=Scytonema hofmannii PCC 7110 TaxID=128403 RepID=A0A139WUE0_9CYAN|nr:pantothenate kinase [Scytonema hofmannii]KYC36052.1 type III pantothenate kinase [Scytonema hofmannii PCC 7110]